MRKMSDYADTNPPATDTPNGTFKNETQPNACDGTDIKAEQMQDPYYALYQILQLAGEVPNGELENSTTNKQFLKSLTSIGWFKYDSNMEYKINSIVINTINNTTRLYRSLVDNNTSSLNNTNSWVNILSVNPDNTIELNSTITDNTSVFIGAFMYGIRNDTPEGWLRCDGNEYPTSAFQIFINNYLLTGKIPYKNLADWQTEYNANNGNCGYFGYQEEILDTENLDENNNPIVIQQGILKTPCLQDRVFVAQALNSGNISKFKWDQIVNITGLVLTGEDKTKARPNGAFYISGTRNGGCNNESESSNDVSFDASRVVRTGDRVQPQHIQYPLFICVSNRPVPTTETQYNGFISNLILKADKNGSNVDENFFTGANFTADTIDYIVESGSNANGFYKKFKSGKTIQGANNINGGTLGAGQGSQVVINLPTPTQSTNYIVNVNLDNSFGYYASIGYAVRNKTTTGFRIDQYNNSNGLTGTITYNYSLIEF